MPRVLIIEDEEKMARTLARVLREEGHVAETAGDGRTGLARALEDTFDLLILDWMLPERSGVQIVRGLRAADIYTPVLMLTARGQVEDRVEGLDAGADDYLLKPFALPELLRGERIDLTAKEFALLAALMQRPGQIFSRSVLLDTVWGVPGEVSTSVVELYVSYLRKKLDREGEPSHIRTVRGVGYTFEPQP
jgi:two-component system OmpR family response regulator